MKKILFVITSLVTLFFISCSSNTSNEASNSGNKTIEKSAHDKWEEDTIVYSRKLTNLIGQQFSSPTIESTSINDSLKIIMTIMKSGMGTGLIKGDIDMALLRLKSYNIGARENEKIDYSIEKSWTKTTMNLTDGKRSMTVGAYEMLLRMGKNLFVISILDNEIMAVLIEIVGWEDYKVVKNPTFNEISEVCGFGK